MKTKYPKKLAKDEYETILFQMGRALETGISRIECFVDHPAISEEMNSKMKDSLVCLRRQQLMFEGSLEKILAEVSPKFKGILSMNLWNNLGDMLPELKKISQDMESLDRKGGEKQWH